jgi:Uma2 family endonuclease
MATISLEDHGRTMTLDEFIAAQPVEGYRYELVRGHLFAEDIEPDIHGQVVSNLYWITCRHDQLQPGMILRVGGGANFLLCRPETESALRPDLGVVLRNAARDTTGHRKPALVAEVVSATSAKRDYRIKREEYLAFGILEYWIVDLPMRKMTVLVRHGDVWVERPCVEGQPIPSVVLPGLESTVADLWIKLEGYDEEA